jgi:hypothetical protein
MNTIDYDISFTHDDPAHIFYVYPVEWEKRISDLLVSCGIKTSIYLRFNNELQESVWRLYNCSPERLTLLVLKSPIPVKILQDFNHTLK